MDSFRDRLRLAGETETGIFRLRLNYFNILLRFPRDYEAVFQRMIDINARIRDMDDPRFPCKVYCGFGIYPLEEGVDFLTANTTRTWPASNARNGISGIPFRGVRPVHPGRRAALLRSQRAGTARHRTGPYQIFTCSPRWTCAPGRSAPQRLSCAGKTLSAA